jgi:hypothetical protein
MARKAITTACALLLVVAAGVVARRTATNGFSGIDFVQFSVTGQHVVAGGDPRVWSPEVRASILSSSWNAALAEAPDSRLVQALRFRQQRSWETYSSPFLYAVFGVLSRNSYRPADTGRSPSPAGRAPEPDDERAVAASSGLATTFSPGSGEKELSEHYERCLRLHQWLSAVAVVVGCVAFGLALRIPNAAMLCGAGLLPFFSPLRSDQNVGNVAQLQFGMLGVFVLLLSVRRHTKALAATPSSRRFVTTQRFAAAAWLGVCLAFKPTLLWVPLVWWGTLVGTEWRRSQTATSVVRRISAVVRDSLRTLLVPVAGCLTGGLLAVAFSAIWFPLNSWIEWVQAVMSLPDDIIRSDIGNCSPTYFAIHSLGWPTWLTVAVGPLLLFVTVRMISSAFGDRHRRSSDQDDIAGASQRQQADSLIETPECVAVMMALACQIQLLTSRLVWYHYLVLSSPALLVLLSLVIRNRRAADRAIAAVILVWSAAMLGIEPLTRLLQVRSTERAMTCFLANVLLALVILLSFGSLRESTATPECED